MLAFGIFILLLTYLSSCQCFLFSNTQKQCITTLNYPSTKIFMSTNPSSRNGKPPPAPQPIINELIRGVDRVRLIGTDEESGDDTMIGIMSFKEALEYAKNLEVDLVMINDKGDPPVCKAIDYGKFKYSQDKKKKENLKKQVKTEIKEVKMSYKIDQHDFDVRVRAVQKFLSDGDKVKVIIQFKGREMQHKDLGQDLLVKILKPVEEVATLETNPKMEGRSMTMLLSPKQKA